MYIYGKLLYHTVSSNFPLVPFFFAFSCFVLQLLFYMCVVFLFFYGSTSLLFHVFVFAIPCVLSVCSSLACHQIANIFTYTCKRGPIPFVFFHCFPFFPLPLSACLCFSRPQANTSFKALSLIVRGQHTITTVHFCLIILLPNLSILLHNNAVAFFLNKYFNLAMTLPDFLINEMCLSSILTRAY